MTDGFGLGFDLYLLHFLTFKNTLVFNPVLEVFGYRMFEVSITHLGIPERSDGQRYTRAGVTVITRKKQNELIEGSIKTLPLNAAGDLVIDTHGKH